MDFDELLPSDVANVVTDEKDPQRLSGNFLRIDENSVYVDPWWMNILQKGVALNIRRICWGLESCKDYVVKCEFRHIQSDSARMKISFSIYHYWRQLLVIGLQQISMSRTLIGGRPLHYRGMYSNLWIIQTIIRVHTLILICF